METLQSNVAPPLPAEIWAHICAFISEDTFAIAASTAMGLRTVCKSWASAMDSTRNLFWKHFVETCFPAATSIKSWINTKDGSKRFDEMYSGLYYSLFRSLHACYLLKPVQQQNYGRLRCGRPHLAPTLKPQTRWVQPSAPQDSFLKHTPVSWAGKLYVATQQGSIKCFSLSSGHLDWTVSLPMEDKNLSMESAVMEMSLKTSGGSYGLQHEYFTPGCVCLLSDSTLFVIDPKLGRVIKKVDFQQELSVTVLERSMLVAEGVVIIVCRDGGKKLVAFAFDCLKLSSASASVQECLIWSLQLSQPWCDVISIVCAPLLDLESDLLIFGCSFEENITSGLNAFGVVLLTCSFFNPSEGNLAIMPEVVVEHGAGPQLQPQLQVSTLQGKAFFISNEYSNAKVHIMDLKAGKALSLAELLNDNSVEDIEAEWLSYGFSIDPYQPRLFISKQSSGGGGAFGVELTGTKISPKGSYENWSIDDSDSSWKRAYGIEMDKQMAEYPSIYGTDVLFSLSFFGDTIFISSSYGQIWIIGASNYGSTHTLMPVNVNGKKISLCSFPDPFSNDEIVSGICEGADSPEMSSSQDDSDDGDMFDDSLETPNVCVGVLASQDPEKSFETTAVMCVVTEYWIWACSDEQ